MTEREITVRAIEAYLTADKKAHRKPKAEQILAAIERLGYVSPEEIERYDMYEALKAQHDAIDILFAMLIESDSSFFPSKSGLPWEALLKGNKAIAEVEGRTE